eukprot:TRINITY_DN308_c0_g1_i5.p1 TRINITY_DN308_c0_g1~~TRINITY_DN308_c0_g1_i5.p1  ORF type:complete len:1254 (+),score=420.56 TRINITY_DN308_c0_g1_i5:132-3893(+)
MTNLMKRGFIVNAVLFLLSIGLQSFIFFNVIHTNSNVPSALSKFTSAPVGVKNSFHEIYVRHAQHPSTIPTLESSPSICSPLPPIEEIEQCLGEKAEKPVISPLPILDSEKMDYSNLPGSDNRPRFRYMPGAVLSPLVTILTPFYNTGPIIHETAKAVLGQSLQRFQWIIVNDGSKNATQLAALDIYRKMGLTDSRIVILDLPTNKGLPGARNEGLKLAQGKYLLLLDPDDLIENTFIEKAVWFLESNPHYTLTNAYSIGFGHKNYTWSRGFHDGDINLRENMLTVATVMRTDILRKIGGFDENLTSGMEDWDLWMRFADNGHWGHTLPEFLFWYRVSPPGKWASIYNETKFNEYMSNQKAKYTRAFSEGVPKLAPIPQDKYEATAPPGDLVANMANPLKKCRPRLLVLLPYMEVGGADQFNYNFLVGMVHEGWEVTIATDKDSANKLYSQFMRVTPDIFIMPRFSRKSDQPRFIAYLIESRRPDVVFTSNSEHVYHYLPYLRAFAPGPAFVDYVHSETPQWKSGGYARYSAGAEPWLDRSLFASEHLRQYVIDLGHNPNKTATVLIGIDSDKYVHNPADRVELRSKLGVADDKLVILYVARLEHEKQPEMFAQVMKNLRDKGLDFMGISIGGGSLLESLNDTVYSNNLQDHVKLLGTIPNTEVSRWVSAADVFFLPSKVEGISLAIYESMSMGVTCVSARVGGQAELVVPEVGFLVKPGSPTESAEYEAIIERLIRDPIYTRQLGVNSRKRILSGFKSTDTIMRLKTEFCNAAKAHSHSRAMFHNTGMQKMGAEFAALGIEYERASDESLVLWKELQGVLKKLAPPVIEVNKAGPTHTPSPYTDMITTPEDVLESIVPAQLRPVTDIMQEKGIDRSLRLTLLHNEEPTIRTNPKTVVENFDHNKFFHQGNHDVDSWDDSIPFPFAQQQYVAVIPHAFVAPGDSGTVFDWDRMFTMQTGSRKMFTQPSDETSKCEVKKYKKLTSIVQLYNAYGHFLSEQLPRLALIWDRIRSDPEMHILVPDMGTSVVKEVLVDFLKIPQNRLVFYRYGSGWDPCHVYYAEELYMINPTATGNPSVELMDAMRQMFLDVNPNLPNEEERNLIVYMSRKGSVNRKVDNEDELIKKLRESLSGEQFMVWDGSVSVPDTISMMRRAKMIIGPHGQNLAPSVFAQKGTTIVELMHSNPWLHWWGVSTGLQLDYWFVPIAGFTHESDFIPVPIDLTIQTVQAALRSRGGASTIEAPEFTGATVEQASR